MLSESCRILEVTRSECAWLQDERRRALREAFEAATLARLLRGVAPRGWTAHLRVHGRDRDGSVRASVRVAHPSLPRAYVRRLRCVLARSEMVRRDVSLRRLD